MNECNDCGRPVFITGDDTHVQERHVKPRKSTTETCGRTKAVFGNKYKLSSDVAIFAMLSNN